ncbi:hypothetical protein KEM52_000068 [Ascosphaera acerosa]|nr:hypothetical protein KEM52_000068 [Ascosphaera acerosa]
MESYDVVIVGAGPVGLLASLCLSRWGHSVKHIDNRPVPTKAGRADGIQPRSLEILRNLGLKREIMAHEPARVFDVSFWDPSPDGSGIVRTGNWPSCPRFIDTRYPFTTLLHQGLIERAFIKEIEKAGTVIERPSTIIGFARDADDSEHPVRVTLKDLETNIERTVRAKYLFDGEGAKSFVRQELGIQIRHKDPISHVWGVMDGRVHTDFPDIRTKCTIHSAAGSIMVIPRENNLVRLYIQIASSTDPDFNPRKTATVAEVQAAAKKILKPYHVDWEHVDWYSVYPIGQGIADRYTLDHRIFLGGDAVHTHSPKAGQGMNTAFHDALNFAWKVHLVEREFAAPELLHTYESERKAVAETLLAFDNKYAKLFSQRPPSASEVGTASGKDSPTSATSTTSTNEFVETFKESCEFTSGYGVAYGANVLNWHQGHPTARSALFNPSNCSLVAGRSFPCATVTRLSDANAVELEQEIPISGAFRIHVYAGDPKRSARALADLAASMCKPGSFYTSFQHDAATLKSMSHFERHNPHSPFYTLTLVYAAKSAEATTKTLLTDAPSPFRAYRHHIYADDQPDVKLPTDEFSAHEKLGLTPTTPVVVVVRPDNHVACTIKLVEGSGTGEALDEYFSGIVGRQLGEKRRARI